MKITTKITEKEKRLLFILFTIILLVASYQFGYVRFSQTTDKLGEENIELTNKLMELQQKQANKEKMMNQTEDFTQKSNDIFMKFPSNLTEEKNTIFITELESYADMKINSIAFRDITSFYSSESSDLNSVSEENDNNGDLTTSTEEEPNNDETVSQGLEGYETTMVLSYQTTYAGLKKAVEFINEYPDLRTITDLSAAFDNTTGNLTGSLTIQLFAATGTGSAYVAPNLDGISLGTSNIFGSFELPVDGNK